MRKLKQSVVLCALLLGSAVLVHTQKNAEDAFAEWKAKAVLRAGGVKISYEGVAVSAKRTAEQTISVKLSLGASLDYRAVDAVTISAEPVLIDGTDIQILGRGAKIRSGQVVRDPEDVDEIVFHPSFELIDDSRANGIKVTITGLGNQTAPAATMIVGLSDKLATSVLGTVRVADNMASSLKEEACSWWVGYCDSCTLCVGCSNNSRP